MHAHASRRRDTTLVSHKFPDLQMEVTQREMQQHTTNVGKGEDSSQINIHVNGAVFEHIREVSFQIFYEDGNAFIMLEL